MNKQRQVHLFPISAYGCLVEIGRYNYASAKEALETHSHQDCYEFCYVAKGQQVYEIEGDIYSLKSGDIFFTRPGEIHSSANTPEQKSILYWVQFKVDKTNNWINFTDNEQQNIIEQLKKSVKRQFKVTNKLQNILNSVFIALDSNNDDPFSRVKASNALSQAALVMFEAIIETNAVVQVSALIADNINFIKNNLCSENLVIETLATQTGLSVSRYKSRFKKEIGYPPADYIMRKKIKLAKKLLSNQSLSILDIALELNFDSSQYFSTVFKRYVAQTPSEFRKKI
jgi:AraC-like DNA-binding protein/mannose-6-phosphate isomerase-like protein (cupin superfamily)